MDIRVRDVSVSEDELTVALMDGRTIAVPLAWYPRLANGTPEQRARWEVAGGGYGIHWPDLDENLSTEGLLAPRNERRKRSRCRKAGNAGGRFEGQRFAPSETERFALARVPRGSASWCSPLLGSSQA